MPTRLAHTLASPVADRPAASTSVPAVRVRGLVKRYRDGTEANAGIDFEVEPGRVVAILGPNGAGKTTFLRQLTGELEPTSGSIEVFGVDVVAHPMRAKAAMGITPQEAGVFEALTVKRHLEVFARLKGLGRREARDEAASVAAGLGLSGVLSKRVGLLSGGQRRRVLVGLALLGRPPLLVLDEPTTGLDPESRREVWERLRAAVADGATVVLSTHSMEEAERLADRVALFVGGRLIAFDSVDGLVGRVGRRYRLGYDGGAGAEYFDTFADAELRSRELALSEYSIARTSLEDAYFALAGRRLDAEEAEP